ncbi:MAG: hypothetical protein U1C51_03305 [Candidatus Izemoplasmatales bacterium]|nr:hypothetical protein [Candidatus Izemoplasmatales bacterium]
MICLNKRKIFFFLGVVVALAVSFFLRLQGIIFWPTYAIHNALIWLLVLVGVGLFIWILIPFVPLIDQRIWMVLIALSLIGTSMNFVGVASRWYAILGMMLVIFSIWIQSKPWKIGYLFAVVGYFLIGIVYIHLFAYGMVIVFHFIALSLSVIRLFYRSSKLNYLFSIGFIAFSLLVLFAAFMLTYDNAIIKPHQWHYQEIQSPGGKMYLLNQQIVPGFIDSTLEITIYEPIGFGFYLKRGSNSWEWMSLILVDNELFTWEQLSNQDDMITHPQLSEGITVLLPK